jgi:hypothetical protein
MARRTEEHHGRREQPRPQSPSSGTKKRKPRGPLFHGDDPTLAKRVEEELHNLGR